MAGSRGSVRAFAYRYVIALGLAAVSMIVAVVLVNYVFDEKFSEIERVEVDTIASPTEVTNFLLIGSDTRNLTLDPDEELAFGDPQDPGETAGQRSDTLMVIHVDPNQHKAVVVSFPRDLWVEIPNVPLDENHCARIEAAKCMARINSAFSNGIDVVINTLQQNFQIPINHYIEVDFKTFQGVVDAIGSVPIYFPYPTRDDDTGLYTPVAGCHELDGKGALAYVRARHLNYYSYTDKGWYDADATADLARIKRQQDFMRRLMSLAVDKSLNNPLTANSVVDRIIPNIKIDDGLEKDDLLGLIDVFSKVDPASGQVEFLTLPGRNGAAGTLSVLYVDEASAVAMLDLLRSGTGASSTESTTTTTLPVVADPSIVTTTTISPTTTTTAAALAVQDDERFGAPAPNSAPCV